MTGDRNPDRISRCSRHSSGRLSFVRGESTESIRTAGGGWQRKVVSGDCLVARSGGSIAGDDSGTAERGTNCTPSPVPTRCAMLATSGRKTYGPDRRLPSINARRTLRGAMLLNPFAAVAIFGKTPESSCCRPNRGRWVPDPLFRRPSAMIESKGHRLPPGASGRGGRSGKPPAPLLNASRNPMTFLLFRPTGPGSSARIAADRQADGGGRPSHHGHEVRARLRFGDVVSIPLKLGSPFRRPVRSGKGSSCGGAECHPGYNGQGEASVYDGRGEFTWKRGTV